MPAAVSAAAKGEKTVMRASVVMVLILLGSPQAAFGVNFLTEESPPLNFMQEGRLVGVSTAIVREMAQRANVPAVFALLPWKTGYARALAEADVCLFSTARQPARNALFKWLGPISRGYWSAFSLEEFADYVPTVDSLKKYRVGVVSDARAQYLRQRGFTNLVESDKDSDLPKRLTIDPKQDGGIDLWVTQGMMGTEIARKAGAGKIKEVMPSIMSQEYWLACNLQVPPDTLTSLSSALSEMKKDGTYKKLTDPRTLAPAN